MTKPPEGLTPQKVRNEQRLQEIKGAVDRYMRAELMVSLDWIEEYNKLVVKVAAASNGKASEACGCCSAGPCYPHR